MNEGAPNMAEQYPTAAELRHWAQSKRAGAGVSHKGNMPRFVILAWNKAHPDRPYVRSQNFHGTANGYSQHGCRCEGCAGAGRADARRLYEMARDERDQELADALLAEGVQP